VVSRSVPISVPPQVLEARPVSWLTASFAGALVARVFLFAMHLLGLLPEGLG
jgi:hypothetical protein